MFEKLSLSELIARFLAWSTRRNAPGTVADYRRHLLRFLTAVGDVDVATLKPWHLMEWGRTWHNFVAVQRLFNWACKECELIERNPFSRVKRPRPGGRRRLFSPAELSRFLRAAAHDFRAYLLAMRESIARPQEVRALRWHHVRSTDDALPFEQSLTRGLSYFELDEFKHRHLRRDPEAVRVIPISARLGRLLLRLWNRDRSRSAFVFRTSRRAEWTKEKVRLRMKRLRQRLGVKPDARGETLVCYSIRHTMATDACARGVRDRVLAELMGHTNTRTTARYQHLSIDHLMKAMTQLRGKN